MSDSRDAGVSSPHHRREAHGEKPARERRVHLFATGAHARSAGGGRFTAVRNEAPGGAQTENKVTNTGFPPPSAVPRAPKSANEGWAESDARTESFNECVGGIRGGVNLQTRRPARRRRKMISARPPRARALSAKRAQRGQRLERSDLALGHWQAGRSTVSPAA